MGSDESLPALTNRTDAVSVRRLTDSQFQGLASVPPEIEWFANIHNPRTRRAYETDIDDFSKFVGIHRPEEFRSVTRSHVIAWRKTLEERALSASTIRRKLSALSSLFEYLCECNSVPYNPVDGVKRPSEGANEGRTPAIGDGQTRALFDAPDAFTLKGKRDRAILAVFLYHGLRCEELCYLKVRDIQDRRGVKHLRIHGKGDKIRFVPAHVAALERISTYLEAAGHGDQSDGPLFRAVKGTLKLRLHLPVAPFTVVWSGNMRSSQASSASDSASIPCGRRRQPMRWTTKPTSPRCRSGSAMRAFPPHAFMTSGRAGLRIRRPSRCLTRGFSPTVSATYRGDRHSCCEPVPHGLPRWAQSHRRA